MVAATLGTTTETILPASIAVRRSRTANGSSATKPHSEASNSVSNTFLVKLFAPIVSSR